MEIFGMNTFTLVILAIIIIAFIVVLYRMDWSVIFEDETDSLDNWMKDWREDYNHDLNNIIKIDETKPHIVPMNIADAPYESVQDNLKRHEEDKAKRDKSGKFVKKTTILPTDYYGAKHNNTVEPNSNELNYSKMGQLE